MKPNLQFWSFVWLEIRPCTVLFCLTVRNVSSAPLSVRYNCTVSSEKRFNAVAALPVRRTFSHLSLTAFVNSSDLFEVFYPIVPTGGALERFRKNNWFAGHSLVLHWVGEILQLTKGNMVQQQLNYCNELTCLVWYRINATVPRFLHPEEEKKRCRLRQCNPRQMNYTTLATHIITITCESLCNYIILPNDL